jgi:hypothetical protein
MAVLAFIAAGLVGGLVARAIIAGKTVFALTGAFLGGLAGSLICGARMFDRMSTGVVATVLGIFFVLFLLGVCARSRRRYTF